MISEQLADLHEKTQRLSQSTHSSSDDWLELIDLRDEIIRHLQLLPEISENDKQILLAIREYDERVICRMNEIMEEAVDNISKINKIKKQNKVYENTYTPASYFIDRRK